MTNFPTLQILTYSFAMWFGLYLLGRHFQKAGMRYAGFGLVVYALGLAANLLLGFDTSPENETLLRADRVLTALLSIGFWFLAIRNLLPKENRDGLPRIPLRLVIIGSIFFTLSVTLVLLPQEILSSDVVILAVGLDLSVLAFGIAALDAYEEGEALLLDMLRSLGASALVALIFGGQVVLAMAITGGTNFVMLLLLLGVIATAIVFQTFADTLQTLLDKVLLSRLPRLQSERAELRAVASALPRVDDSLDITQMPDKEFERLTRRALSHLGDLSRLATSPLTRLPIITERLAEQNQADSTLERAAELRALLSESIEKLKPRDSGDTGISDEWRYYNALYYPYVLGIKPFSRRNFDNGYNTATREVLDWFRVQVPERTLYNWQNAAAKLIAQDLREQM